MMTVIIIILSAYIAGSFPTAIIAGKILRGIDIRKHGSGNAGATNVFRVLGPAPGVFVLLFDIFKGFAATMWISQILIDPVILDSGMLKIIAGCAAIAGHIWTVFAGFRGGKGVGTAAGMLLALFPSALLVCLVVFAIILLTFRIVSLSSIFAAITLPVTLTIFKFLLHFNIQTSLYIFSFFAAGLIIFTHRSNIKRLRAGTENKIGKKKNT